MKTLFTSLVFLTSLMGFAFDLDLGQIEQELITTGLRGHIHGALGEAQQFVFTYRAADDFFTHREFPLITKEKEVLEVLKTLRRHDEVLIRGEFFENGAPITHILVESVEILEKFEDGIQGPEYEYEIKLPEDLKNKSQLIGKVHAVVNEGRVLVIEYKDVVLPVVLKDTRWAKDLFRNDKIRLDFILQGHPDRPTHLVLDESRKRPLKVLQSIQKWHGKKGVLRGELVMFPQSPQIQFNVFAIHQLDKDGVRREFTLVNFDNSELFTELRNRLQKAWDSRPEGVVNARNKFINTKIKIVAKGNFNVVDAGQANPQLLVRNLKHVKIKLK